MDELPRAAAGLLLPLFALIAAIEGWWLARRRGGYAWGSYFASLGDAAGRIAVYAVVQGGVAGAALAAASALRIDTLAMDAGWHWLALFVGVEFCYYWMHRADHRVRWFWLNHSVHHSSNQYALAAAFRLGWTGRLTGAAVFFAPLVIVGFPLPAVLAMVALNLVYQFWLHTELVGRLGPLEWVLNTPAHHRVHHASNPEYLDCNYGGVLIVFDRLFGTLRTEQPDVPCRYGLVEPIASNNPLRIVWTPWCTLLRDLRDASGWRERLRVLFGPPGFRPRGQRVHAPAQARIATK